MKIQLGNTLLIMFDFHGTLTATPGGKTSHTVDQDELKERASLLRPWLQRMRDVGADLGIASKGSRPRIKSALEFAGLDGLFNGPLLCGARGVFGKAGVIEQCFSEGIFKNLGPDDIDGVVLVDDDMYELTRAAKQGMQIYAAPEKGGLQEEDLLDIFCSLTSPQSQSELEMQDSLQPQSCEGTNDFLEHRIGWLWTARLTCGSLGDDGATPQLSFGHEAAPKFREVFEVLRQLGRGSFQMCYTGKYLKSGDSCMMKFVKDEALGKWHKEALGILLRMRQGEPHPNVIQFLDFLKLPDWYCIITEPLQGRLLSQYSQDNAEISEAVCRCIMRQAFSALSFIHSNCVGLIHRDLKLDSLLVRRSDSSPESAWKVVLVDFGTCCSAIPKAQLRQAMGTSPYTAPEIFSQQYGVEVDIWSAGVLLYILLTGQKPWKRTPHMGFDVRNMVQYLAAKEKALDLAVLASFGVVSVIAADLFTMLLQVEPEKRPSASEIVQHPWFDEAVASQSPLVQKPGCVTKSPTVMVQYMAAKEKALDLAVLASVVLSITSTIDSLPSLE
jgi:serine/threonine protein kinase